MLLFTVGSPAFSLAPTCALSTFPMSGAKFINVLIIEWMPTMTNRLLCLLSRWRVTTEKIYSMWYGFQVLRIDTQDNPAKVVNLSIRGEWPFCQFVGKTVGKLIAAINPYKTITLYSQSCCCPKPARFCLSDLGPETRFSRRAGIVAYRHIHIIPRVGQ